MIQFKYHELLSNLRSKELYYEEQVQIAGEKKMKKELLKTERDKLQIDYMFFS